MNSSDDSLIARISAARRSGTPVSQLSSSELAASARSFAADIELSMTAHERLVARLSAERTSALAAAPGGDRADAAPNLETTNTASMERVDTRADGRSVPEFTNERYGSLELIGEGGFGLVYAATDSEFGRVAIKVLKPEHAGDLTIQSDFSRESDLLWELASAGHSEFSLPLDIGQTIDGTPYYVTPWAAGGTLADRHDAIVRAPVDDRLEVCLRLVAVLARGLTTLGERNIVHQDIKPANILIARSTDLSDSELDSFVDNREHFRIADLGFARKAPMSSAVRFSPVQGTVGFQAPELASGFHHPSMSSDIFSATATVLFCLTGLDYRAAWTVPVADDFGPDIVAALSSGLADFDRRPSNPADWGQQLSSALRQALADTNRLQRQISTIRASEGSAPRPQAIHAYDLWRKVPTDRSWDQFVSGLVLEAQSGGDSSSAALTDLGWLIMKSGMARPRFIGSIELDDSEREEIEADTLMIALKDIGQLSNPSSFRSWVRGIAVTAGRRRLSSEQKRERLSRRVSLPARDSTKFSSIMASRLQIAEAFARLTKKEQLTVALAAEMGGLARVAEFLGEKESTTRSRHTRALRKLQAVR